MTATSLFCETTELMKYVSVQSSSIGDDPWLKAIAGPIAGVAIFIVGNLIMTKFVVPLLKDKDEIDNAKRGKRITEIAKIDTENIGKDNLKDPALEKEEKENV